MSHIISNFDADDFLENYWQQCPLLIRGAFPEAESLISGDDLAGLASEPDVESRIIKLDRGSQQWSVEHGPFDENHWSTLDNKDWTLLVQAVDHWDEDVADLRQYFSFLPSWRVDDVMVSFATQGGGVGPHFDQYDVFLIQGEGRREWKIGQMCAEHSELIEHLPVKVLAQFDEQDVWVLEPGDMLYLPPALAHWGTALDNCVTYSVGFRAPAHSEVISDFGHFLANQLSDFDRYSDRKIENRSTAHSKILASDINRVQQIIRDASEDKSLIAHWLGQYMTEPKYNDTATDSGDWSVTSFHHQWQLSCLVKNPASRFAYYDNQLFVDGSLLAVPCDEATFQFIDNDAYLSHDSLRSEMSESQLNVLCSLINLGALYFDEDS